jgi:glutathione synthase/RimK-type ligase-like ATP-grasp enzyme
MFALKCKEHKIPTPETILLCGNVYLAKKELTRFGHWPVVMKRISGTMGEFVDRAESLEDVERIMKGFWHKGEKLPIIAQEYVDSQSYRVTVIGGKIVQTALKENRGWKATGVYTKEFKHFKIDRKLKKLVKKVIKMSKINICGIDFIKKDDKWMVLEVNSVPAFDFFPQEREKLADKTLNLLKKYS